MHTDSDAAMMANSLNARAFTIGQDIVFGSRQHTPETFDGKEVVGS